jgi:hypothetical protein
MLRLTNIVWVVLLIAVLVATGAMPRTSVAQKASVPKPQDKLALGEDQCKQLLLLMDTNKNGKVSKEEFMHFMEAEFDRLAKNKSGDLDVNELKRTSSTTSHPAHANVGK